MNEIRYDREAALQYAREWALSRNPRYGDFTAMGGDCTNFISQCLYAGCGVMNYTPDIGWFYRSMSSRSAGWTGVQFLYNFVTLNKGAGPFGHEAELPQAELGDIIQLSFDGQIWRHSLMVSSLGGDIGGISVTTHDYDAYDRPLLSYNFKKCRLIHIDGARK